MSTIGSGEFLNHASPVPLVSSGSRKERSALHPESASEPIDPALVQQTKNEIRGLVQEITQLSQSDMGWMEFQEEFLRRVVSALASIGGAIWMTRDDGGLELSYQVNLPKSELVDGSAMSQRHQRLIANVMASGQPTLVPPQSGAANDDEAGNPTDSLLVLACIRIEHEIIGVVEIFQRAGGGPTTQRGYLRFLVQMCELASDYLKNRRLRHLGDRQTLWEHLEQFLRAVHRGLDSQATAFTIVNECRRLVRCDRVSIALRHGRHYVVLAVSGLDTIDRRAAEVRQLGQLATIVAATRRPMWYTGDSRDLPPQIDKPLHTYLDQSHAKLLAVVPLDPSGDDSDSTPERDQNSPLGMLIVEQMADSRLTDGFQNRVDVVAAHSAAALANALEHESLFLMPLWRTLGKAQWIVQARTLPKTVAVIGATVLAIAALICVPADFHLAARGKLQPSVRREIFAHLDGIVIDVPVKHEQSVRTGDVLARMANNGLEVDIVDAIGRKRTTQERIRSLTRAQFDQRLTVEQQNKIAGEMLELAQTEESIDRELALLREQQERLVLRSEMNGQVITWNVGDVLSRRPVQRGQALMTVVDPKGDWELELHLPLGRAGHLAEAQANAEEPLRVTYFLASHPGLEFSGKVVEVHRLAEVHGDDGNTILVRVALDKSMLPELRSDTTVTARIECGRRSIGYVVFHELIETVQTKVLFWL